MATLYVEGWPEAIPAGRDTLLDAAVAAGVPIDHHCRVGECGRCRCRLLSGDIKQLAALPGVLEEDDRSRGWILACRSLARSDVTIEVPRPLAIQRPKRQRLRSEVIRCAPVTPDVIHLMIEPERPLEFHAGQYVALQFAGLPERNYSPANAPGDPRLSFLIRAVPGGIVSTHVATALKPGDQCRIDGPYGSACLSAMPEGPLLLAGGGTGLAPMLSILGALSEKAPSTHCDLYVGARRPDELLAEPELACVAEVMPELCITPVFSEWAPKTALQGFIAPVIAERHESLELHDVYIAGPPPMVESVEREVIDRGAAPERIRSDPFVIQCRDAAPRRSFGFKRLFAAICG